jgi:hypothetical protein
MFAPVVQEQGYRKIYLSASCNHITGFNDLDDTGVTVDIETAKQALCLITLRRPTYISASDVIDVKVILFSAFIIYSR